jgi:hypothetical protein
LMCLEMKTQRWMPGPSYWSEHWVESEAGELTRSHHHSSGLHALYLAQDLHLILLWNSQPWHLLCCSEWISSGHPAPVPAAAHWDLCHMVFALLVLTSTWGEGWHTVTLKCFLVWFQHKAFNRGCHPVPARRDPDWNPRNTSLQWTGKS